MRADLVGLEWLSMEHALLFLKDETGVQLSEKDLLAQCDAGRCAVYLNVDSFMGNCPDGLRDEQGEWFFTVYGVGKSQIINPQALIEAAGTTEVQLHISGEVREIKRADAHSYPNTEWVATFPRDRCHPLFKATELTELAAIIGSAIATPRPPKPSHLLAIFALMELLEEKGGPSYSHKKIIGMIDDRYGAKSASPVRGLGASNLEKMFAEAKEMMKDAKKNP